MKYTKIDLLLMFITVFILGLWLIAFVDYAHASERHEQDHDLNLSIPTSNKDNCQGATGIASQHQYFITPGNQVSISGGYYNGCGAASVGTSFYDGKNMLYSGQAILDENGDLGYGISTTIKF